VIHCAVCIIVYRGKVLITQRDSTRHFGGYWEFPGGKQKPGESLEQCALRETKEEVGLNVQIDRLFMSVENPYRDREIDLHFFLCRSEEQNTKPIGSQPCRWVEFDELRQYMFPPANKEVLSNLLKTFSDPTVS